MGNCQAAEAATVLIQHPCGNRVERMYWSVSANQVMTSNPGHYVAVIVTSSKTNTTTTAAPPPPPVKYLKLLRPDDTLQLGHVYRLVSFEEVLKEFATKKHVKLSRLLVANKEEEKKKNKKKKKMRRSKRSEGRILDINPAESSPQVVEGLQVDAEAAAAAAAAEEEEDQSSGRPSGPVPRPGQWRPALQSIAEIGTYI